MIYLLCDVVGMLLITTGVLGFINPDFLGLHLTPIHNALHLATGVLSSYLGFATQPGPARTFSNLFGVAYLGLGIVGFVAPDAVARVLGHVEGLGAGALAPDTLIHLFLGTLFLAAGLPEKVNTENGATRLRLVPVRYDPRTGRIQ